ncbi:hypothetical protein AXF42_Ash005134 [Apostasia shenzhenica]|uniref:Uncharacterized protein n=1 Tax=Apostasia shenzhenica TaxID=1088818 RepID=A0A2I0B8J5_9ASPA|nr:hypothetical protein AXF42_Ash005134 [Apostasia shenzhenica]
MNPQRAQDLVYIHNNLYLLSRRNKYYMKETSKIWDVAPDTMSLVEDTCMFEVTELSLNKLKLEVMLLDDNEDER